MEGVRPARVEINGKRLQRHRIIWEEAHGPIPEGMAIARSCGKLTCMNLDHMKLSTSGAESGGAESNWMKTGILNEKGKRRWESKFVTTPGACWIWTGTKDKNGYGKVSLAGSDLRAHQVAWILQNKRPVPVGLCVLHSCDQPSCVNPDHLWIGSNADNMRDKVEKGRAIGAHKGEAHHNAKLTADQVLKMRAMKADGWTTAAIARWGGVSYMVCKRAIIGETWKHLS